MSRPEAIQSAWVFLSLLGASLLAFLFFPLAFKLYGVVFLIWGLYTFAQLFAFFPVLSGRESAAAPALLLPARILQAVGPRRGAQYAKDVLRSFGFSFLLWAGLGAAYLLFGVLASARPGLGSEGAILSGLMEQFFALNDQAQPIGPDGGFHVRFTAFSQIVLGGLAFWSARAISYDWDAERLMLRVCGVFAALCFAFAVFWGGSALYKVLPVDPFIAGAGWGMFDFHQSIGTLAAGSASSLMIRLYEVGIWGTLCLYGAAGAVLIGNLKIFTRHRSYWPAGFMSCAVGILFLFCDLALVKTGAVYALYLAGWAILGVASARAYRLSRRSYLFY